MPGREILEFAIDLIAMLFVEIWYLKTKGIETGIFGAKFSAFIFKFC